jgi:hypothetical protein
MPPKKKSPKVDSHLMPVAAKKIAGVKPLKGKAKKLEDLSALHAHHAWRSKNLSAAWNTMIMVPVPAGKRLVIEFVTAQISVPAGETVRLRMHTGLGHTSSNFDLVMTPQGLVGGNSVFVATHTLRAYSDSKVKFSINRDNPHTKGNALVCVSGYLVDL